MVAPARDEEEGRIAALQRLHVLDSAPEAEFDALVHVGRAVCALPLALTSLIGADRQWVKALRASRRARIKVTSLTPALVTTVRAASFPT